MNFLRQSTSVDVGIGPFLDETDGRTAETALTLTQPDIRLKKNAGNWAQKAAAQTLTHEENGWYELTLDATDTDTVGILLVAVNESGALPVWREFQVVEEAVYDRDYAAASTGIVGTAQTGDSFARLGAPVGASISADVAAVKGVLPAALVGGRVDASVGAMAANVLTATAINADAITAAKVAADVTTEITAGLATAASIAALNNLSAAQVNAEVVDCLNVDTYAESGVPAATSTLAAKIRWLGTLARNEIRQTAAVQTVRNDANSADLASSPVSDDGTTFTRGEFA